MNKALHPLLLSMACSLSGIARADDYNQLPPPTLGQAESKAYTLYLTLSVNGNKNPELVPVSVNNDHFLVGAAVLRKNYLKFPATSGLVDVTQLPGVHATYDSARQQLDLRVPDAWLPEQFLGNRRRQKELVPVTSHGVLLNYDAYSLKSGSGTATTSTLLEGRFFSDEGTLSQSGVWRTTWQGNDNTPQGYMRYDTSWKYSDVNRLISVQAGDFISDSLTWSNSVRMAGLRISRNFSVRPDLVTYPLLNWSGSAAVPGTVNLFVNGYKTSSQSVNAGPYTLTDVPFINGAGEATVVTTDALGRQVSTTIPFYVSNKLLARGMSDFDLSAGVLRRNYGTKSNDYGEGAFSGIYRYGLTNRLTGSVHSEASEKLWLAGTGADFTPGQWGTLSLSVSHSQYDSLQYGQQYTSGWSYYGRLWSLNLQHINTRGTYLDLSDDSNDAASSRSSDQATLSITPIGQAAGTFGLGYFAIRAQDGTRTRLANASWSHAIGRSASFSLSLNKTLSSHALTGVAQLTIPWGDQSTVNATANQNANGKVTGQIGYTRAAPVEGGLGWTVAHSFSKENYNQANLTWINRYSTVSGGFYGDDSNVNQWIEASGSLIAMDNDYFLSRPINDAFIVADTDGYPDTVVRYENRRVGVTDKQGHLLIPWVSGWYAGKVSIDTMNLPADIDAPVPEKRVAVREDSGAIVHFPVMRVRSAILTLTNDRGQPLPVGTPLNELDSGQSAVVGYDGQAWLSHLGRQNRLVITTPDGECHYSFTLPQETRIPATIGPIECHFPSVKEPLNDR